MTKALACLPAMSFALGLLIAFLAVTGCQGSSSSTPIANSTVSAAAHAAELRGIAVIKRCTPNGTAMIGSVVNKTATLLTYEQVFHYFKSSANRSRVWACASKQAGTAQVPGTSLKTDMETCFADSDAAANLVKHPIRSAHHAKDTATALVDAGAACVGKYV